MHAGFSIRPTPTRRRRSSRRPVARSYVREARRRGLGRRRERIAPIVERLAEEHADAAIALRFRSDLELLVSVMLSAQTTDTNVNRVTPALFEKYGSPEDYLAVPQEELERDIYATGFFRQKAKAIRGTMRVLIEEFDGRVPRRLEELVTLPGVARRRRTSSRPNSGTRRNRRRHARSQVVPATGAHEAWTIPSRSSATSSGSSPRRLGSLPAPADLARAEGARRVAHAATTASSRICARRAARARQIQRRQRKSASWMSDETTMSLSRSRASRTPSGTPPRSSGRRTRRRARARARATRSR